MTPPELVGLGSTTTLKIVVPAKMWSRCGEAIGSELPLESTLVELSSKVQDAPPSFERRKPTPAELTGVARGSPVAAKTIDWLGSLLRPKTAMLPMLMPKVGPKSVSGM